MQIIFQGEEEAIFQDYRKTIRVLMTNLTQLAPDLVLQQVQQVLKITLSQWQTTKWNEVELAITLFYQVCTCFLPSDRNFK